MGVAFISYADIIITGRAFIRKGMYEVDPNQELFALGFANFANGLGQGFAVGASHSRTAVGDMYNGKTQLAGVLACGLARLFSAVLHRVAQTRPGGGPFSHRRRRRHQTPASATNFSGYVAGIAPQATSP